LTRFGGFFRFQICHKHPHGKGHIAIAKRSQLSCGNFV
jgi:hypothetical protein